MLYSLKWSVPDVLCIQFHIKCPGACWSPCWYNLNVGSRGDFPLDSASTDVADLPSIGASFVSSLAFWIFCLIYHYLRAAVNLVDPLNKTQRLQEWVQDHNQNAAVGALCRCLILLFLLTITIQVLPLPLPPLPPDNYVIFEWFLQYSSRTYFSVRVSSKRF